MKGMNMSTEKICFFIAPIGETDSEIRKRSDQVLKHIIEPVARECGYKPLRADQISEPGYITPQIMEHIFESPLVIADLTGGNPNVFYELAVRHVVKKPFVQIINKGEKIPFDIAQMRTIQIDIHNLDSVEEGKKEIQSPLSTIIDINILQPSQQVLADLIKSMEERTRALAYLEFDEKLAVMAGSKEKIKTGKANLESIKNDFSAVSNLKYLVELEKREELIVNYMIPIIEHAIKRIEYFIKIEDFIEIEDFDIIEDVAILNDIKLLGDIKLLEDIIEIALEYNIETDKLKILREKLWNFMPRRTR
jgi:hypothetical protein